MSIEVIEKSKCVGCYACYNICNQQCISMESDIEGFMYPKVNKEICTNCELCKRVCPIFARKVGSNDFAIPHIFAAWTKDDEIRLNSTSGGVFSEIALWVLKKGGYVCGARYGENFVIEHCIIHEEIELKNIRQSKYAQSHIGNIYKKIKELIDECKLVLFCGTPCQCEGLLNYIGQKSSYLLVVDFICRGVNSPKAYQKFLECVSNKYGQEITKVWFKNKTYGWNRFSTKIEFRNGFAYLQDRHTDWFMKGYIGHNLYMRPACEKCLFKKVPRVSDITLADFWGVEIKDTLDDIERGVSLVMVNSITGLNVWKSIKHKIYYEEKELKDVYQGNPYLVSSPKYNKYKRNYLFKHLDVMPFDEIIAKLCKDSFRIRCVNIIKKIIKYY